MKNTGVFSRFFRPLHRTVIGLGIALVMVISVHPTGAKSAESGWKTIPMRVTAYCPCKKCCGEWADGVTSNGHVIKAGDRFVAADSRYKFGMEMMVKGYNDSKTVKVFDRGGAIKGNKLDVFFHTHQDALNWGVRYIDVKVRK